MAHLRLFACILGLLLLVADAIAEVEHLREAQQRSPSLVHRWDFQGSSLDEQLKDRVGDLVLIPHGQAVEGVVQPALAAGNTALVLPSPNNAAWLETHPRTWLSGFTAELLLRPGTQVDQPTVILDISDTEGNRFTLVQDRVGIAWIVGTQQRPVRLVGTPTTLTFHPERWYYLCLGMLREDVGGDRWRYRVSAYGRDLETATPMALITQEMAVPAGRVVGPRELLIGRDNKARTARWDGQLDELAIYRDVLSQQEAQDHAQSVLAVPKKKEDAQ